jgi:hypothetical protein
MRQNVKRIAVVNQLNEIGGMLNQLVAAKFSDIGQLLYE